jgi:hypothetical protein
MIWTTKRCGATVAARLVMASLLVVACASSIRAQNPVQPVFTACPAPADVYSALQVQVAAKRIVDSTTSPRLVATQPGDAKTIAFTVDTLGVPEAGSLVRLGLADTPLWNQVAAAYRKWRFRPARASGCKVRQRVVTAVEW